MAELFMLTEHSPFMMSFVFITDRNRAVIIDGGRSSDMNHLFEIVGDREIAAWIMTHPHFDHISGFNSLLKENKRTEQIGRVYYRFPSVEFVLQCEPQFTTEAEPCSVADFYRVTEKIKDRLCIAEPNTKLKIDDLTVEFLFSGGERYAHPNSGMAVNESSLVFKITPDNGKSVLFLGDLGPEGGKDLLAEQWEKLPSDIVQMSHHGHSGVRADVYEKICPTACLWCCPDWLYEEADAEIEPDLWGTKHQRALMEKIGVKVHYVTKDGTQKINLEKE